LDHEVVLGRGVIQIMEVSCQGGWVWLADFSALLAACGLPEKAIKCGDKEEVRSARI
jgi:hypothetical protein